MPGRLLLRRKKMHLRKDAAAAGLAAGVVPKKRAKMNALVGPAVIGPVFERVDPVMEPADD